MITRLSEESKARLIDGICSQERVSGLTHNFYRYPARFSPDFVRAMVGEFTREYDLVFDPFMGGGTTMVEAMAMGRNALGTDISGLATFISQVKTTTFSARHLVSVGHWVNSVVDRLHTGTSVPTSPRWIREDYQRNINDRKTWRIRKMLEIGLDELAELKSADEQRLARCILLKTGQWALDCRSTIPSPSEFQEQILVNTRDILEGAENFANQLKRSRQRPWGKCLHRSVVGAEREPIVRGAGCPALILTSPPYPGVHVVYHRWQVRGRRETAAPFWIAGALDGDGSSYYTFGDRKQKDLNGYFENVRLCFESVAKIASDQTLVVQMIAFSEPDRQLPRYLEAMHSAGFEEARLAITADNPQDRVWRPVPGRKWYASQLGATGGSHEVVLFHRKRS
jgi:hypothetical protein